MDPGLSQNVPFRVTAKGQKGIDSYHSLLHYKGPEVETVAELQSNHAMWLCDPQRFWNGELSPDLHSLGPQAEIVGCFIYRDRSDK